MWKKWAAGLAAISLGGCALLFQEHLPADYKPATARGQPHCSTSNGLEVLDILFGALDALAIGETLSKQTRTDDDNAVLALAIAEAIVHLGSAHSGSAWAAECEKAEKAWDAAGKEHTPDVGAAAVVAAALAPPKPPPPPPFQCFASATDGNIGLCTRQLVECVEARSREMSPVGECIEASGAACFHYVTVVDGVSHEVCGSTLAICNHRRDAALAIGPSVGDVGECQEAR